MMVFAFESVENHKDKTLVNSIFLFFSYGFQIALSTEGPFIDIKKRLLIKEWSH